MGIRTSNKWVNYSHKPKKPNNKLINVWLEHFWCTDEPWVYVDSQDSPDSPWFELGGSHHLPFIVFFVFCHGACTQMSFCLGTFMILKARNSRNS
jgi:hypothetical protein